MHVLSWMWNLQVNATKCTIQSIRELDRFSEKTDDKILEHYGLLPRFLCGIYHVACSAIADVFTFHEMHVIKTMTSNLTL